MFSGRIGREGSARGGKTTFNYSCLEKTAAWQKRRWSEKVRFWNICQSRENNFWSYLFFCRRPKRIRGILLHETCMSRNWLVMGSCSVKCLYQDKLTTGYPIEKYVGWADMSSNFIFRISGVIPLLKTIFCIWKFCREIYGLIYLFIYSD